MRRLRCGRSSASEGWDLLYTGPVQHVGLHHSTALLEQERGAGRGAAGPTRSRSQDVPLEDGSRYGADRQCLTELFRVDSVLSFIRIEGDLTLPHSPMADTPITSVTITASLWHPKSTLNQVMSFDSLPYIPIQAQNKRVQA